MPPLAMASKLLLRVVRPLQVEAKLPDEAELMMLEAYEREQVSKRPEVEQSPV